MSLQNLFSIGKKKEVEKQPLNKATISKFLRTLSRQEAFHFYIRIGEPAGYSASSLLDFCKKIRVIDIKSLKFHSKRGDFEKWIRLTLGDTELADKIGEIRGYEENLRNQLYRTVYNRLRELREMQTQFHV
ncbi:MAG: DUF5752 family protein [Thermoproteota archaeon]|nr:DUF5752 family protein [Thermoproteota archaeon]